MGRRGGLPHFPTGPASVNPIGLGLLLTSAIPRVNKVGVQEAQFSPESEAWGGSGSSPRRQLHDSWVA